MKINYTFVGCLLLSAAMLTLAFVPYPNETPRSDSTIEILA